MPWKVKTHKVLSGSSPFQGAKKQKFKNMKTTFEGINTPKNLADKLFNVSGEIRYEFTCLIEQILKETGKKDVPFNVSLFDIVNQKLWNYAFLSEHGTVQFKQTTNEENIKTIHAFDIADILRVYYDLFDIYVNKTEKLIE